MKSFPILSLPAQLNSLPAMKKMNLAGRKISTSPKRNILFKKRGQHPLIKKGAGTAFTGSGTVPFFITQLLRHRSAGNLFMYLFSVLKLTIAPPPPTPLPKGEGRGEGDILIVSER